VILVDGIAHFSALFCQQIESSCSFISYNFNNSLQPDDVVEHIYRGAIALGLIFCPSGNTIVLGESLRRPFFIYPIANL
jgi:hypothetical protein